MVGRLGPPTASTAVYLFGRTKSAAFYRQVRLIQYDPAGTVKDVDYSVTGER